MTNRFSLITATAAILLSTNVAPAQTLDKLKPVHRPFYLPLIYSIGAGPADAQKEVAISTPDAPSLVFTVPAGSATFDDGGRAGIVQVMLVAPNGSVKDVKGPILGDKVPMTQPDGPLPAVAFAIMPAAVHFDPPAPIRFPNVEGLARGARVTIYSYDHDLSEFVQVGKGQVSQDGQQVVPDKGLVHGGWYAVEPIGSP